MVPSQESYQPEYERLNLEPEIMPLNRQDPAFTNVAGKQKRKVIVPASINAPISGMSKESVVWEREPQAVNRRVKVREEEEEIVPIVDVLSDQEYINDYDDSNFDFNNVEGPPKELRNKKIEVEEESRDFDLKSIRVNEYVLLYEGQIISYGSRDSVKKEVVNLIDQNGSLLIKDFIILKRVSITAGVFIDE